MKKAIIIIAILSGVITTSCNKTDNNSCSDVTITAPASEVADLRTFLQTSGIIAVEDPRGFFYTMDVQGTGSRPSSCSNVAVNYTGRLTNGTTFDSGNNVSFSLTGLIIGWQEGIPLIAPGGSITLYLPPSLAYGPRAVGSIPANSNLIFKIDLLKVY